MVCVWWVVVDVPTVALVVWTVAFAVLLAYLRLRAPGCWATAVVGLATTFASFGSFAAFATFAAFAAFATFVTFSAFTAFTAFAFTTW